MATTLARQRTIAALIALAVAAALPAAGGLGLAQSTTGIAARYPGDVGIDNDHGRPARCAAPERGQRSLRAPDRASHARSRRRQCERGRARARHPPQLAQGEAGALEDPGARRGRQQRTIAGHHAPSLANLPESPPGSTGCGALSPVSGAQLQCIQPGQHPSRVPRQRREIEDLQT